MNDLIPATLCQLIYTNLAYFDKIFDNGSVYVGYKFLNGDHTLTFRGSDNKEDWIHDLESLETTKHAVLGIVGKGFIVGVDDIYSQIKEILPQEEPIKIYGHSLGCSHAFYFGGLSVKDGHTIEIVAFEPPRSSNEVLNAILAPYPVRCYRNGQDIVTQVPTTLSHPREVIQLNCPPVAGDVTPFKYHHMPLPLTAMAVAQITGSY